MSTLLYYPSFEINNEEWLKFALLYLESVETIVPHYAESSLSEKHKFILKNTDLLKCCNPTYDEGEKASDEAIEVIERIISNPIRYWQRIGVVHFLEYWREEKNHKFELYHGKFSNSFLSFCKDKKIYSKSENGIFVPYEVGLIYMSLLAHSISDRRNRDIITDSKDMDNLKSLSNRMWQSNPIEDMLEGLKYYVKLKIPSDIKNVSIEKLINLRNNPKYRESLKDFHQIVDKISKEKDLDRFNIREIENELEYKLQDIQADLVINLGTALISTSLGIILAAKGRAGNLPVVKEAIGVGGIVAGSIQLSKGTKVLRKKHSARKFLTYLNNL